MDDNPVTHAGKFGFDLAFFSDERAKSVILDVRREVFTEARKSGGSQIGSTELRGKVAHGIAIHRDRLEKPAVRLIPITNLFCLGNMRAHIVHAVRESSDALEEPGIFKVRKDVLAVFYALALCKHLMKKGFEVVLFFAGDDGSNDLIEIEVRKKVRFLFRGNSVERGAGKENARHEDIDRCVNSA
ncbi:MAG TPA: hypothetical protein VMD07_02575 [Candidatus Acidoferrales bacterium]|nr:hypothetical protein [Candidatus Acidoferrales bacterium]